VADLKATVRDVRARVEPYVERGRASIIGRVWERLLEITFLETSVALAAKAFVALFPLLVVFAAVAPSFVRESIAEALRRRMGIDGDLAPLVQGTFGSPQQIRAATGVLGLLFLFFYATSFTSALQRVYLRAWRRPKRGAIKNYGRGLLWLVGLVVGISLVGSMRRIAVGAPETALTLAVAVTGSVVLWWWTAWMLLRSEVRWRPLLPGAVLTAVGMMGFAVWSQVWMPHVVRDNAAQFGFFGIALSLVSWLVGISFVIVGAAAINAVLVEDEGVLGRLARGRNDQVLRPDAPEALPAPILGPRLIDAVRRGMDDS
jgi:membrane protein